MITPQEYKQAQKSLKLLYDEEAEKEKILNEKGREVDNKYYKLIQDLKDKQRAEEKIIYEQKEKLKEQKEKQKEPIYNYIIFFI